MDIKERIEVLTARERNLRSSILSVQHPSIMLDHAAKLEDDAQMLIAKAKVIRATLLQATESIADIRMELFDVTLELAVLEHMQRLGMKPKKFKRLMQRIKKEWCQNELHSSGERVDEDMG